MGKKYPAPAHRDEKLTRLRNLKMAKSAHAYVRGNTIQFYEWLEASDRVLPHGPPVWICGDCHVSNIGPIADADGNINVQIRDLDQTVIGNPAHDIIRLGVSLAMAARGSDLPGVITAKMMEQLIVGYELALSAKPGSRKAMQKRPETIQLIMKRALRRKWKHLAAERIEGLEPNIPLSKNYWPISDAERAELKRLMSTEEVRVLATSLIHRDAKDQVEMLDAAYWVKGCSSLGLLRYAVLLRVGESKDPESSLCLIDVKEAVRSAAPRAPKVQMPKDNALRIIQGALHLAPNLGERMLAGRIQGKAVFLRELLPQDLKIDLEHLSQDQAMEVAAYLGNVVGRAHVHQMKTADRERWLQELSRNRPKTIDAPSWLWQSVVELVKAHEGAYLEHCRRFANLPA
ncbi:DUF2252 family protein [Rhodanobacter sp. C03]|uniref:DUF2252 family protein n=1 Tax=Rhodanobacter sp. C03 TaxID=1945858 RepID=UPI0009878476|nr:DUF2252 family protein [Rhodanobacter sp. C03]OOG56359.1 hypothetical protein B0E48_09325 [Rhodanobacter sp. C03]